MQEAHVFLMSLSPMQEEHVFLMSLSPMKEAYVFPMSLSPLQKAHVFLMSLSPKQEAHVFPRDLHHVGSCGLSTVLLLLQTYWGGSNERLLPLWTNFLSNFPPILTKLFLWIKISLIWPLFILQYASVSIWTPCKWNVIVTSHITEQKCH